MSDIVTVDRPAGQDAKRSPNVVDVGAWLSRAKSLRGELVQYVPKHRAPGPAV